MTDEQILSLMKGVVNDAKAETLTRTEEMILASEARTAERIDEKTYAMETKLLKEFRKWGRPHRGARQGGGNQHGGLQRQPVGLQ
jgi:hypothetical protein